MTTYTNKFDVMVDCLRTLGMLPHTRAALVSALPIKSESRSKVSLYSARVGGTCAEHVALGRGNHGPSSERL